jgi:hypothetical protein
VSAALARSRLERFDPAMFGRAADILRKQAEVAEERSRGFAEGLIEQSAGRWTGKAADALHDRAAGFERTHAKEHMVLLNGMSIATVTQGHLAEAKGKITGKVAEVEGMPMFFQSEDGSKSYDCGDPFEVADDFTVHVKPLPGIPWEIVRLLQARAAQLAEDVKALVGQFESLDAQLGQQIRQAVDFKALALDANGHPFIPYDGNKAANDAGQAIADGKMAVPSDPKQLHDLWEKLDKDHKEAIYNRYHDIGNHGGIPFDPPDHLGRDHYNNRHLGEITGQKEQDLKDARGREPHWNPQGDKTFEQFQHDHAEWERKCADLQTQVDGYHNLRATLDRTQNDKLPRFLGIVDDKGHGSVSTYNPDYAKYTGVVVPGTYCDLTQTGDYDDHSQQMIKSAVIASNGQMRPGDLSVTEWFGYDRPMSVSGLEGKPPWAGELGPALNGAPALDQFIDGLRASHQDDLLGGRSHVTVIGHSYGTTLVGAAATGGNHLDADSVVLLASPGAIADSAHGLSLAPSAEVFTAKAFGDIIEVANIGGDFLEDIGLSGTVGLGEDPTSWKDAYRMDAGVGGHGSYWDPKSPAMKNIGKILIGDKSEVTHD